MDLNAFLKKQPAAPAAAAPAPEPKAKPPVPEQVVALLLAPPPGADGLAQFKAFEQSYEIGPDVVRKIVESQPEGYSSDALTELEGLLPKPAPEVEPDPQPVKPPAEEKVEKPTPKRKRGRPAKKTPGDGDPLTREERMALACAALRGALGDLQSACEFVIGGEGGEQ